MLENLARICKPFKEPGIDSQPGRPARQPYLPHRSARLHRLAESIPGLHKLIQIRALNNSADPLDNLVLKVVIIQGDRERLCGGDPVQPGHRRHHDWQVRGGTRRRKGQDKQVKKEDNCFFEHLLMFCFK
jgi:hypothetical protein